MALAHCIVHGHTPTDLHEADPKRYPSCFNSVAALTARVPEILGTHYAIHYPGTQLHSARNLKLTPLHSRWLQHKAHFGQFFGWERPLYFECRQTPRLSFGKPAWFDQVGREVAFAHQHAAIFDQSSFGKISVRGADAETFLNRVCSNDMTRPTGRAIYTAMLNERGGYESDLTAVRLGDDEYRLYLGTSAIRRDLAWLTRHLLPGEQVDLSDQTDEFAILGLMGPDAAEIATRLGADELNHLGFFCCGAAQIAGVPVHAVRLSYVGEAGWELCCKVNTAESLFDALIAAGAQPAGIFAQSSMRIEKRFLAFGHDLDTDLNPFQASLGFTLDWNSEFIGKSALLPIRHQTPASLLVSILFDDPDAQPIGNEPVYHQGTIVGKTTSASFGYRVGKPVAIALIENLDKLDGLKVDVDIAGSQNAGTIHTAATWNPIG